MNIKKALNKLNIFKLDLSDKTKRTRWLLRILALVFGVVLWMFVTWDGSTLGTREIGVPLRYLDIPDGYSISNTVHNISVVVEARAEVLALLGRNSITASVSLNELQPGKYRLPVQLNVPENMRLVSYNPQVVDFSLFRIIQRALRPSLTIKEGEIPDNLSLSDTTFSPPEIVVRGPEADVLAVRKVEARGTFAELRTNTEKVLPIVLLGDNGEISGLTVEPQQVRVVASFTENKEEMRVPIQVPVRGNPGENLEIDSISVSPDVVTLRGSAEALANTTALELNEVDVSGITEDIELDVPLNSPKPNIEIVGPKYAKVRISLDSATETKTYLNVPIRIQGKGIYKSWRLSPASASVTIERPVTIKGQVEHSSAPPLELYVDVANVVSQQLLLPVLVKDLAQEFKVIRIEPEQITVIALMQ